MKDVELQQASHLVPHKGLNETIIHALEAEVAKKASEQLAICEPKENNAIIEAINDLFFQKYSSSAIG